MANDIRSIKDIEDENPRSSDRLVQALVDYRADDTNVFRYSRKTKESAGGRTTETRTDNDGGHKKDTSPSTNEGTQTGQGGVTGGGTGTGATGGGTGGGTGTGAGGTTGGSPTPQSSNQLIVAFLVGFNSPGAYFDNKPRIYIEIARDKNGSFITSPVARKDWNFIGTGSSIIADDEEFLFDSSGYVTIKGIKYAANQIIDSTTGKSALQFLREYTDPEVDKFLDAWRLDGRTGQFGSVDKKPDEKPPQNTDRYPIIDGKVVKTVVGPDGKEYPIDPKTGSVTIPSKNADGTTKEITYDAKTYLENKKQDDAMANAESKKNDAENKSTNGQKTNTSDAPSTKPGNEIEKNEAKAKSNASPQPASENVDKSAALTEAKLREINRSNQTAPSSIIITSFFEKDKIKSLTSVEPGYWGWRTGGESKSPNGVPENELDKDKSGIAASVRYRFGGTWDGLTKSTGRDAQVSKNKNDLKIIDYPIIMNFPEVGIWNKTIPYVAQEQTEQHMVINPCSAYHIPGGYGIGQFSQQNPKNPSWGEAPWWCGISTVAALKYGGYSSVYTQGAGAGQVTAAAWKENKKIINEKSDTFASFPAVIENGVERPVHGFLDSGWDGRDNCPFFLKYYNSKIEKRPTQFETKVETKTVGKGKNKKKITVERQVPIKSEEVAVAVYEGLLPNPNIVVFVRNYHFTDAGVTKEGKKLLEHVLSQKGWEVSVLTKGKHVEVAVYLNPDGTGVSFGGNTVANTAAANGGTFAVRQFTLSGFCSESDMVAFSKCVYKGQPQKVESTMNGLFKRTPIVDSYYRAAGSENVLSVLKSIYNTIVEK